MEHKEQLDDMHVRCHYLSASFLKYGHGGRAEAPVP